MEITYQGTDITPFVQVRKCLFRETAGERCDSLEMEFENAAGWDRWGLEEDDQITVSHDGLDTGIMYLCKVMPEDGKYRLLASSLPCRARKQEYRSFTGRTIEEIMRTCAAVSNMDFAIYGIDGQTAIPYIQQEKESTAAFLDRLMRYEGAALKCINGKYTAIGIAYAQEQRAQQTIEITAKQRGTQYRRDGLKYKGIVIKTPHATARAEDTAVPSSHAELTICGLPAMNDMQAGRWARSLLLNFNRRRETLVIDSELNTGFSAMARINIESSTQAAGEWLIQEVEHDIKNKTSTARLHRCIYSIQ